MFRKSLKKPNLKKTEQVKSSEGRKFETQNTPNPLPNETFWNENMKLNLISSITKPSSYEQLNNLRDWEYEEDFDNYDL